MATEQSGTLRIAGLVGWGIALGLLFVLWQRPGLIMDLVRESDSVTECDLATAPCTVPLDGGGEAVLDVLPAGLPSGAPLTWTVRTRDAADVSIDGLDVTGLSMNMGLTTIDLSPESGRWIGQHALPICTSSRMQWRIDLRYRHGDQPHVATLQTWSGDADTPALPHGQTAAPAVAPTHGDFTIDTADGALALSDLRGRVVFLYFGYTACPDICPTTLATFGQALDRLDPDERARVAGLFVSLDPERDALPRLQSYATWFAPELRAGTASPDRIAHISADWGVAWAKVPLTDSAMGYAIDHSTDAFLVATDGTFLGPVAHGTPPDQVAAQLRRALTETPEDAPPPQTSGED